MGTYIQSKSISYSHAFFAVYQLVVVKMTIMIINVDHVDMCSIYNLVIENVRWYISVQIVKTAGVVT